MLSNLSTISLTTTACVLLKDISTVQCSYSGVEEKTPDYFYQTTPDCCWCNCTDFSNITNSTAAPDVRPPPNMLDFYIGLLLAVSSTIFIGTSYILKKKGLLRLQHRAGQGGYGYLKEWLWWAGLIMMIAGEGANFAAYAFAPATLVTPLGALSVLVSSVLASKMLKEKLNLLGKIGCLVCILGATMIVIHSPKEQELQTMDELGERMKDPVFLTYVALIAVMSVILIFYASPRWGQTNPLVFITVTGAIGSLSVMGCKGLGVALKQTFAGDNQFTNWLTWFVIISVAGCITVQMNYLNKALDTFNTSIVSAILYVVFTSFVILASAVLFKEWGNLEAPHILGNLVGFVTTVSGIFLLQAFKDVDITLSQLRAKSTQAGEATNNGRVANSDSDLSGFHRLRNDESQHDLLSNMEGQIPDEDLTFDITGNGRNDRNVHSYSASTGR